MSDITKELTAIKQKLANYQEKQNKAEAKRSLLMEELTNDFGCSSIKQAKKLLDKMYLDISEGRKELDKNLKKLKKLLPNEL